MFRLPFGMHWLRAAGLGRWWNVQPNVLPQGPSAAVEDSAPDSDGRPPPGSRATRPIRSTVPPARRSTARLSAGGRISSPRCPPSIPKSGYAADAYYWRAFALYRLGGTPQLKRRAAVARRSSAERYPQGGHARATPQALEARIKGELARRGDPDAIA